MANKHTKMYTLVLVFMVSIIAYAHKITYSVDSYLVSQDKRPIFVLKREMYKDGGTTVYAGLGYQVIKWNMLTTIPNNIEFGYEIYKSPNFRDINDGPTKKLKIISNK